MVSFTWLIPIASFSHARKRNVSGILIWQQKHKIDCAPYKNYQNKYPFIWYNWYKYVKLRITQ